MEQRGLVKVIASMGTVLRWGLSSKRQSTISAKAGPSTAAPAVVASTSKSVVPEAAKEPERPDVQATKVPRSQIYEERARKLAERYGIEIKPDEWHASGDALRVEKPIRMRVRRVCHVCQRPFGAARECSNCGHPRCKDCGRYPPKRTEAEKEESRKRRAAILKERSENAPIIADWDLSDKKIVLKRPGKPGGQDLVHKKPRQRVRRTCHQCHTVFLSGSKRCESCGHARCTDCPRDPAKRDKYPYGYPGDEFGPNAVPYYECHECKTTFPPDAADETECSKCSHRKCSSCQRLTPRKIDPEPDPVIWQSLQAKLQAMHVT